MKGKILILAMIASIIPFIQVVSAAHCGCDSPGVACSGSCYCTDPYGSGYCIYSTGSNCNFGQYCPNGPCDLSGVCGAATTTTQPSGCTGSCNYNGVRDCGETGIDCGGSGCPACGSCITCTGGTSRCDPANANNVQYCTTGADGCTYWLHWYSCSSGETCSGGSCVIGGTTTTTASSNPCSISCGAASYCRDGDWCVHTSGSNCNLNQYCPAAGSISGNLCYYGTRSCNSVGTCSLNTCTLGAGQSCSATSGCLGGTTTTTVTTQAKPAAPTNLAASVSSCSGGVAAVKITWKDNSNNEQGFRVKKWELGKDSAWVLIATTGTNTQSFTWTSAIASKDYWLTVGAYNSAGETYSNEVEPTYYFAATCPTTTTTTLQTCTQKCQSSGYTTGACRTGSCNAGESGISGSGTTCSTTCCCSSGATTTTTTTTTSNPCSIYCGPATHCLSGDWCVHSSGNNCNFGSYCPAAGTKSGSSCFHGTSRTCSSTGTCGLSECILGPGQSCSATSGCVSGATTTTTPSCDPAACKGNYWCYNSQCKECDTQSGYANCDGNSANGCETNLKNDRNNCGTCGSACGENERCVNGKCACSGFSYPECNSVQGCEWCQPCAPNSKKSSAYQYGTCVESSSCSYQCVKGRCGAECSSNDDCVPKLEYDSSIGTEICKYGTCNTDSCACSYQSKACPERGTVIGNTCYYGTGERCIANGCALQTCQKGDNEACYSDQGCQPKCTPGEKKCESNWAAVCNTAGAWQYTDCSASGLECNKLYSECRQAYYGCSQFSCEGGKSVQRNPDCSIASETDCGTNECDSDTGKCKVSEIAGCRYASTPKGCLKNLEPHTLSPAETCCFQTYHKLLYTDTVGMCPFNSDSALHRAVGYRFDDMMVARTTGYYCPPNCGSPGCGGPRAYGIVAVDREIWPCGTKFNIQGQIFTVTDTGCFTGEWIDIYNKPSGIGDWNLVRIEPKPASIESNEPTQPLTETILTIIRRFLFNL